jgi:type VI secretion system protein ImpL
MTPVFIASLVVAAVALALIVLLMWRARRATAAAAAPATSPRGHWRWVGIRDDLRRRYAVVERAVRYVLARRDWRYRSSWILLLGLPGDGKSSLAASIPETLLRGPQRKDLRHETYLSGAVAHTQWHFLEQGVLIDPEQSLVGTAGDAGADARWRTMLGDLESLRPDRAVDGLLWTISAARLLAADEAELQVLARQVLLRINDVQEQFAYALPVYVVVTQCDAVQGFQPFWEAQDLALRREMVGWSSPTIDDNGLPSEWVDIAFSKLIEGLRALVLASATTHDEIADVDGFFLFPQYMKSLQAPLLRFLEVVFKPNMYETRAFCRGIYFTGATAAPAAGSPSQDVAFLEGLLRDKVFAEQRLAQRTRKGLLARNRLIRRLQIGTVATGLLLAAALPWTASRVNARTDALRDTLVNVSVSSKTLAERGCLDAQRVYGLLEQVAALDTHTRYGAIPASWVDRRINHGVAHVVSASALRLVVLPSLACRLDQRIEALSAASLHSASAQTTPDVAFAQARSQLKQQLGELAILEDNLARFEHLAQPGMFSEHKALMEELAELAQYAYQKPLPSAAMREGSALSDGLVETTYPDPPRITPALRQRLAEQFERMAADAGADLQRRVEAGVPLLATLKDDKPPVLAQLRAFNGWLHWVRSDWLLSSPEDNPCSREGAAIAPGIEELIREHHYDASLRTALNAFNRATCYQPAVDSLRQATLAPYGPLFVVDPKSQVLQGVSPGLSGETAGLKALADLGFMQLQSAQDFSCDGSVAGWRSGTFDGVLAELREYQLFVGQQHRDAIAADADPLYDRLARTQLERAIEDSLARNQRTSATDAMAAGLDAVSELDRELSTESANLSASLGPLLQALQQLRQLRLDGLADRVGQCARNYASGMLMDVSGLASASQLYDPPAQPGDDDGQALFDLGTAPVLQAYLDRQLARAQVLAGYAAPFVTLLKNSRGVSDSRRLNAQTDVYWDNTIGELNRAVQFAEPAGQVGALNDFFLKQLGTISYATCASALDSYVPPPTGNDLFSMRREAMENLARLTCSGHGQADSDVHFFRIAMLFNSELAGRYPFGPAGAHEVSLATVKAFFVYYASEKPALETYLASAKGDRASRMKVFIDQLDAVQAFFAGNLSGSPQSGPVVLDVGFRALPQASPLSNQLIAWTLGAGGAQVAWPGTATTLPWAFGQPLSLDLQWADRSRFTPLPDPTQADLGVSGREATFAASGPWALLHLIDAHRPSTAGPSALDPMQELLEFDVPVLHTAPLPGEAADDKARLYLTLKLSATDPATKAAVPLAVPVFPQQAPVLW